MVVARPRVFIASARESLPYAHALQELLEPDCEVTVWDQDVFLLSRAAIDSLLKRTRESDYAVMICNNDDRVFRRGKQEAVPRDNVIFELGLFIGALGLDRVFVVAPSDQDVKLPTDLDSVTYTTFVATRSDGSAKAALGPASAKILREIRDAQIQPRTSAPPFKRTYVAAVCYKRVKGDTHFLLVNSSKNRWIVPKGLVLEHEGPEDAARRYAHDEGGVIGSIFKADPIEFGYLKEEHGNEQRIMAYMVEAKRQITPKETFRNPTWFAFADAEDKIAAGRDFKYANEARNLIRRCYLHVGQQGTEARPQVAALPFRRGADGTIQIALITSRNTVRWTLPKGNISTGSDAIADVAREAHEEAGLEGRVQSTKLCSYEYLRQMQRCVVDVYPMEVTAELKNWPERNLRIRRWFDLAEIDQYLEERSVREAIHAFAATFGD